MNAEATLNNYKERVWAGKTLMVDDKWRAHGYNQWQSSDSEIRADEALSVINQAFYAFSYINGGIHDIVAESFGIIADELSYFAERVNINFPGTNLPDLGNRQNEYLHNVVVPRMERVEYWVTRRLRGLRTVWEEAQRNGHPRASDILRVIQSLLTAAEADDAFFVDTTGFPDYTPE